MRPFARLALGLAAVSALARAAGASALAPGDLIVVDRVQRAVVQIKPDGSGATVLGTFASLTSPTAVTVSGNGDVLVADEFADAGSGGIVLLTADGQETLWATGGDVRRPAGVALAADGALTVYVADTDVHGTGGVLRSVDGASPMTLTLLNAAAGAFASPSGIARGSDGILLVADPLASMGRGAILGMTADGDQLVLAGGDPLVSPSAVAAGRHGVVYITDPGAMHGLGAVFSLASATPGAPLQDIAHGEPLVNPLGIAVGTGATGKDVVYVADGGGAVIAIDPASGTQIVLFSGSPLLYPTAIAVVPTCGNGLVEGDEECDPGQAGVCCNASCRLVAAKTCGSTTTTTTTPRTSSTTTTTAISVPPPTLTSTTQPCSTARCGLEAAQTSDTCAGQAIPARVTNRFTKADDVIERSASAAPARKRILLKKAKRILTIAKLKAIQAGKGRNPRLSPRCAAMIRNAAEHLIVELGV